MNLGSRETSWRSRVSAISSPLLLLALFLVVAGVRLWMISIYSSSLPIRDQWDYEGAAIFKPWMDGTFRVSDLFRPHNEHRLVLARVLALGLLGMNGQWDSRLETVVVTLICALFAVAAAVALAKIFEPKSRLVILLAVALWLTLPYGQENALLALGASYYFLVFFSLIAIWGIGLHRTFSVRWWVGAASLILGCLDMASGVFAAMTLLGLLGLRLCKRRVKWKEVVLPALLLVAVIGGAIYFRTIVPRHDVLKAASLGNWLHVFARCLAWPFCDAPLLCVLMYLPAGLVGIWYLRAAPNSTSAHSSRQGEAIIVVGVWVAMQGAAIAYTRGGSTILLPVSRYMDILAFGAIANLLAAAFVVRQMQIGSRWRQVSTVLAVTWAGAVVAGAAVLSYRELPVTGSEPILLPYEQAVRGYVATGDRKYLEGDPEPPIPYPNASRLASLLDDPGIKSILPTCIRAAVSVPVAPATRTAFVANGYPASVTNSPYERTWGSYSELQVSAVGTLRSESITSPFPYLEFETAGQPRKAASLSLEDEASGRRNPFAARTKMDKDWRSGYVAMPGKNVRLVARDENPAGWFAFREPREAGRFSVYADRIARLAPFLCLVGGILGLTFTAVSDGPAAWRYFARSNFLLNMFLDSFSGRPENMADPLDDKPGATVTRRNLRRYLLLFLACIPIFVALRLQLKYWVNIPIWDEWDTPGIAILHAAQHQLSWGDLLAQHNESRKVVPRLVAIALAGPAGWDVRQGMVLTFLSACLASAFVFSYLRRQSGRILLGTVVSWAVVNLLLFAPSQYENFLSGFMWEVSFPILCLFICIKMNLSARPFWAKALCNSLLALLSTYTFAHGMLLWFFAFPLRSSTNPGSGKGRAAHLIWSAIYLIIGAASIAYYFRGYFRPSVAPPPATFREIPQVIDFLVVWLGANFRSGFVNARVAGGLIWIVVLRVIPCALLRIYQNPPVWKNYYPWLLLAGFSLGSGLITAIGRAGIGVDLAFNTGFDGFSGIRYNGSSVFACVGLVGIIHGLYADPIRISARWRMRFLAATALGCLLLGLSWIFMFVDEVKRLPFFEENRQRAKLAAIWARVVPANPEIVAAYPQIEGFAQRVEELKQFSVLKLPSIDETLQKTISSPPPTAGFVAGFLDVGGFNNGKFRVAGWARNPRTNAPADYVLLGWQESPDAFHPFAILPTGGRRPDLIEPFKTRAMSKAGFDREIDVSKLPRASLEIRAWAIDRKNSAAFPLGGVLRLEPPSD